MTPEQWQQVGEVFHSALAYEPGERAAYLAQACRGDEVLLREVESLISFHDETASFIETPAGDVAAELLGKKRPPGLVSGEQLAHYRVISSLGAGGMGEVYLAEDTRLGRQIALKVLPVQYTTSADRISRLDQEARAASALNHPNIVTIHEIGRADSGHFIATEFIEGQTLREHLAGREVTLNEVLDIAAQVASALAAAHKAGIVHRDIKPENIMLRGDGIVKVLDFGLAKLALSQPAAVDQDPQRSMVKSNPGVVMGTVQYMSPEQARGLDVDARSDIFSLGTVIYEMIAGQVPFDGATTSDLIVSILEREPAPLSFHAPEAPAELERIVKKALAKDRGERYQLAKDLLIDLRNLKQEIELRAKLDAARTEDSKGATPARLHVSVDTDEQLATRSTDAEAAHTVPSAAYLVGKIKIHRRAVAFGLAALLITVAAIMYFTYFGQGGEAIDSVAVLPFVNVSGDPNTQYLSDGISDSIINNLSELPGLKRVIALNSTLRYKGQQVDPQTVGREFNVQAVLMGRLTQQGDDLWIRAELVDVRDNRRLWGEQYNRKLSDILVVQREIARQISSGLRLRLSGKENKQIAKQHTENPNAEISYLKGRHLLHKRTARDTEKSIEYLEEAIRLDPNYALAYATLANAYLSLAMLGPGLPVEEVLPRAKDAVEKALAINNTLAEAHAALGSIRFWEWDWSGAEGEFKRAIELNPNYKPIHPNYEQYLLNMKRVDEAVAESKRGLELDPVSAYYNRNVAMILYFARRYDEAIEQCQKTLELDPNMGTAYNWLWRAYEQKGMYDQAVEAYLKFFGPIKQDGPEAVAAFRGAYATSGWKGFWRKALDLNMERAKRGFNLHAVAENYARLGEKDQALFWLEKSLEQREVALTLHCRNPFWDGFRSDPRFADLVRRMGLEP